MKISFMEAADKEKRIDNSPEENQKSPMERIETPFPAQEVFPLEQARNDGKQKSDMEKIREESDKSNNE